MLLGVSWLLTVTTLQARLVRMYAAVLEAELDVMRTFGTPARLPSTPPEPRDGPQAPSPHTP